MNTMAYFGVAYTTIGSLFTISLFCKKGKIDLVVAEAGLRQMKAHYDSLGAYRALEGWTPEDYTESCSWRYNELRNMVYKSMIVAITANVMVFGTACALISKVAKWNLGTCAALAATVTIVTMLVTTAKRRLMRTTKQVSA